MSNQSGIVASEELRGFLSTCRDGNVRCVKVLTYFDIFYTILEFARYPYRRRWRETPD